MKNNWIYKTCWVLLLFVIFMSCEELPCDDADGVQVNVGFYTLSGQMLADTTIDTLTLVLYNEIQSPYADTFYSEEGISFPLSQIADSSLVIFIYKNSISDTLLFNYDKTLILENHKCGFANYFELNDISTTSNRIDSVWIRKNLVEYGDEENVKIYF